MNKQAQLRASLSDRSLVKVISGIANTDVNRVMTVVRAAQAAGAGAVDVAADVAVLTAVLAETSLPVFASSVSAQALIEAAQMGVDAVEVGNFDALYADGYYITAEAVYEIAQTVKSAVGDSVLISVTVPGHLSREAQMALAAQLEALGVDMIQTEGVAQVVSIDRQVAPLSADSKFRHTLANTWSLVQTVKTPVMTASGINPGNAQEAIAAGASAVGLGSAVNQLTTPDEMQAVIESTMLQVAQSLVTSAQKVGA